MPLNLINQDMFTATNVYSDGTVYALTNNAGPSIASSLTVINNGSIHTESLTVSDVLAVSGHNYSPMQLTLKANTMSY